MLDKDKALDRELIHLARQLRIENMAMKESIAALTAAVSTLSSDVQALLAAKDDTAAVAAVDAATTTVAAADAAVKAATPAPAPAA